MKVPSEWHQSKFVVDPRSESLRGSRDAANLSVSSRLIADRVAAFYTRAIRDHAHGHLLDLGCGRAPFLGYYARFVEKSTLVDWGNSMHQNTLIDVVADLNEPLPLSSNTYDTVLLSDVLEHIAEPKELLREVSRILSSNGGVLLLNVPFFYPIHEEPYDFHRYTRFSLERMCEAVGLKTIDLVPIGGAPEILIDITSKCVAMYVRRWPSFAFRVAALIQSIGARLTRLRVVRHVSARSAEQFPLGYALVAVKQTELPAST